MPSVPLVLLRPPMLLDNGLSCATFACKYRHFSKHFRCHCKSRKEGVRRLQCCSRQRNGFFKVTIERTFWALWFSCFYDNFAYTLANATWSAMCQNVLMSKLEANFYGRQKCSFDQLWSDFVADFDLPLDIWKFHLSIFIGLFWTLLILWSLTQIEVLRVIYSQSKITEIVILKIFCWKNNWFFLFTKKN